MRWTPFSSSGGPNASTERVPMKYYLMEMDVTVDGGGHLVRTNLLLLCRSMCKRLTFALIWLARPQIPDGPKHGFFYLGTERPTMVSLVPFCSVPQGRIELRRPLQTFY